MIQPPGPDIWGSQPLVGYAPTAFIDQSKDARGGNGLLWTHRHFAQRRTKILSMPAVTSLNIRRSERNEVFGRSAAVRSMGVQYFIMAHHNNGSVVPIRGNPGYSLTIPPQNCPHDTCADLPRYPSPPLCSRQGLTRSNRRGTDPYAWWCGRGDAARRPAIPILGHEDQFPPPRLSVG